MLPGELSVEQANICIISHQSALTLDMCFILDVRCRGWPVQGLCLQESGSSPHYIPPAEERTEFSPLLVQHNPLVDVLVACIPPYLSNVNLEPLVS